MRFMYIISLLCCLLSGCVHVYPSDYMRKLVANNGNWYLISSNGTQPIGIAVSINTDKLFVLLGKNYILHNSRNGSREVIEESHDLDLLKNVAFDDGYLTIEEHPELSFFASTSRHVRFKNSNSFRDVYGAWLNLDMIFLENSWCEFILIDDLANGFCFSRPTKMNMEDQDVRFCEISKMKIIARSDSYQGLFCVDDLQE